MPRHIIHTQKVRLQVANENHAWDLQNRVGSLLKTDVLPSLENLFDEICPDGEILRIDTLAIQLDGITPQNLEAGFTQQLLIQLREALMNQTGTATGGASQNGFSKVEEPQSLLHSVMYFLRRGYLPWYSPMASITALEDAITTSFTDAEWKGLISFLQQERELSITVLQRLIYQFSSPFLGQLLCKQVPSLTGKEWEDMYSDVLGIIHQMRIMPEDVSSSHRLSHVIWQKAFDSALQLQRGDWFELRWLQAVTSEANIKALYLNGNSALSETLRSEKIKRLLKQVMTEENKGKAPGGLREEEAQNAVSVQQETETQSPTAESIKEQQDIKAEDSNSAIASAEETQKFPDRDESLLKKRIKKLTEIEGTALYSVNCGLVILHPFLHMYFEELGLLDKKIFTNEFAQRRAVLLLHYLATGESNAPEMHLLLPKLLCAMDIEEPVENEIKITEKELKESDDLLRSVLKHWAPLHNTSVQGLQQTFLQRDGKLEPKEDGWLLTVEQKTVDILMDKLPWGLGTLKLPWMNGLLYVDWC